MLPICAPLLSLLLFLFFVRVRLTIPQWHLAAVEVVSVGTGVSYLFVCGQWLSLERGHCIVEKDYDSGKIQVGVILENADRIDSQYLQKSLPLELEILEGTESDVKISLLIEHPVVRKAPMLYRYQSRH